MSERAIQSASVWTIVVAAGSGQRFGSAKQYEDLLGQRVMDWSLAAARSVSDGIVLVVPPERVIDEEPSVDVVVAGGETRSDSVRRGLAAVPTEAEIVLVHDAPRPAASPELFRSVVDAVLTGADCSVPVVDVTDSVTTDAGEPVDRASLRLVQTPQGFRADVLRRVHLNVPEATDDASLVYISGGRIRIIKGDRWNLKITEPFDLQVMRALLGGRE